MKERVEHFLTKNGWQFECDGGDDGYSSYTKDGLIGIDVSKDEIVFIDDSGDVLHINCCYYALIGALMECRQIGFAYISVKSPKNPQSAKAEEEIMKLFFDTEFTGLHQKTKMRMYRVLLYRSNDCIRGWLSYLRTYTGGFTFIVLVEAENGPKAKNKAITQANKDFEGIEIIASNYDHDLWGIKNFPELDKTYRKHLQSAKANGGTKAADRGIKKNG